jgi:hypothetical protein
VAINILIVAKLKLLIWMCLPKSYHLERWFDECHWQSITIGKVTNFKVKFEMVNSKGHVIYIVLECNLPKPKIFYQVAKVDLMKLF